MCAAIGTLLFGASLGYDSDRNRYDMAVFIHREFRTMQAMVQYVFMRSLASPG